MDYSGVRARVLRALVFRALLNFSGVIVTAWHAVRRPPSPSLPPSLPATLSIPAARRANTQATHSSRAIREWAALQTGTLKYLQLMPCP
jgi:hypothetical protein